MPDFTETNINRRTRENNLYSIITWAGQYQAVLEKPKLKPNLYEPPIDENSNSDEVIAWENAKRLSAILYIAIEGYGEENEYSSVNGGVNIWSGKETGLVIRKSVLEAIGFIGNRINSAG